MNVDAATLTPEPLPHLAQDLEDALDAATSPHLSRRDVPRELLVRAAVGPLRGINSFPPHNETKREPGLTFWRVEPDYYSRLSRAPTLQ
jgi:hypothetical protein